MAGAQEVELLVQASLEEPVNSIDSLKRLEMMVSGMAWRGLGRDGMGGHGSARVGARSSCGPWLARQLTTAAGLSADWAPGGRWGGRGEGRRGVQAGG